MRAGVRPLFVAAFAVLAAAGVARAVGPTTIGGEGAVVEQAADRVSPPDRAVLISDSAWLGIYFYGSVDAVRGFDHTLALASCRRRVVRSCTNYDGFVPDPLITTLRDLGDAYSTLIVATGYNDGSAAFADEFRAIVGTARELGYRRIVWLTLRTEDVTYVSPGDAGTQAVFVSNNRTLLDLVATADFPEVTIADWATYARDHPDWFAADGIHLRPLGTYAASDYVSRLMAHLDGRACPAPFGAGAPAPDPCPDPDLTGPVVDLDAVYPTDRPAPRPPFALEFVGHGSWPDPPWWES